MFDYPLSIPVKTAYQELNVPPDASADEIREAKTTAVLRIQKEKARIEADLGRVYGHLPALGEVRRELRTQAIDGDQPADSQRQAARLRLIELEREAEHLLPGFKALERRVEELTRREIEINGMRLEDPASRKVYDDNHPPLALLKLADCTRDAFTANGTAIHLVRRELSEFLAARGEPVFHPTDLTQNDFSADFSENPFLDKDNL